MRLDQLKEEDIANDPQYKSWLRIYKKSKDAAEAHPKHSTFVKYYNSQTNEGLADMADVVERDHEVQMARSDLYKLAKYSIKLHEMLKSISEHEGLEGWQQSKITKAADYISSVYHALDYDMKFAENSQPKSTSYTNQLSEKLAEYKKKVLDKETNQSFETLEESVGKLITEEEFDKLAEKKDACYHKVKSRYKVWPSAYASGALVQCRKKGAKNWGNKSK